MSHLILQAITVASDKQLKPPPKVVRWTSLDKPLATGPKAAELKKYIKQVSEGVSDHMPVVSRFYFKVKA